MAGVSSVTASFILYMRSCGFRARDGQPAERSIRRTVGRVELRVAQSADQRSHPRRQFSDRREVLLARRAIERRWSVVASGRPPDT